MFTFIVIAVLALLIWMALSTFKTSRNSRLPEEIIVQRYQTKQAAKANTGGAIIVGAIIIGTIYVLMLIFPMDDEPEQVHTASVTTQSSSSDQLRPGQVKVIVP